MRILIQKQNAALGTAGAKSTILRRAAVRRSPGGQWRGFGHDFSRIHLQANEPAGPPPAATAASQGADGFVGAVARGATNPAEVGEPPEPGTPQSSGPGISGGKPDPSLPDCTAVMGGRQVDYWAAKIIRAQHTFMNFKLDSSNYWLVEAGPLPADPKKSGAWAKFGDWDTRGERVRKTFGKDDCAATKDCLLDTTAKYHAAGVTYNPTSGPNSNSFLEHLTFKCKDLPRSFIGRDIAWDYWTKHPRPF